MTRHEQLAQLSNGTISTVPTMIQMHESMNTERPKYLFLFLFLHWRDLQSAMYNASRRDL